nr:TlpA disulfide reductase family protein [Pedobacter kyonggii]
MLRNLLLIALLFTSLFSSAQGNNLKKNVLNEQSVVRGEDGLVYPYHVWKKLMATGKYGLRDRKTKTESGKPEYVIVELTQPQKVAYFESITKPTPSDVFMLDQVFTGVKVTDMNGQKFDLRNLDGKTLVLNFWFTGGSTGKMLIPQLNDLFDEFKDNKNVVFLSICNNDKNQIKDFLKETPFKFNIVDDARNIAEKYNVKRYPTTVVIDKNNQIKFSSVGVSSSTGYWIKKAIEESLVR